MPDFWLRMLTEVMGIGRTPSTDLYRMAGGLRFAHPGGGSTLDLCSPRRTKTKICRLGKEYEMLSCVKFHGQGHRSTKTHFRSNESKGDMFWPTVRVGLAVLSRSYDRKKRAGLKQSTAFEGFFIHHACRFDLQLIHSLRQIIKVGK